MSFRSRLGVKRKLGQALYGSVYLCEDMARNGELVAVKEVILQEAKQLLSVNRQMDNPWQERTVAEKLTKLGSHQNIVQYYDNFTDNGAWYISMEYCEGGDLFSFLREQKGGRVPEDLALAQFREIAQGVQFLHRNGIAHRDVSLENVLLRDGTCKLSDFGLSTDADRTCSESVGKAYYMSPEMVAEQEYDPKAADVWALGVALFMMLTGSPVVQLASADDKAFVALQTYGVEKILAAWGMAASVTKDAIELLESLLQPNPMMRPSVDKVLAHPVFERLCPTDF